MTQKENDMCDGLGYWNGEWNPEEDHEEPIEPEYDNNEEEDKL